MLAQKDKLFTDARRQHRQQVAGPLADTRSSWLV
jgi:hypothetical protein